MQTIRSGNIQCQDTQLPSFCVVLPCHNEEAVVAQHVTAVNEVLQRTNTRTGIILVNDASTDNTAAVLRHLEQTVPNIMVETHAVNGGYGGANRTGFARAINEGFEYALVMDADGTQDPRFITNFFEPMSAGVDFIKGSRYRSGSQVVGVDWRRKFVSKFGNALAQVVLRTKLTDYTNGFRAIKVSVLSKLATKERGFAMLVEEVAQAKKLGATFGEIPYVLTVRTEPGSTSKFTYSWNVYCTYLKHVFKR